MQAQGLKQEIPGRARAWVLAARPATLPAAAVPVLVGTACAAHEGSLKAGPAAAALLGSLLIQLGTNFANDVFDFEKGADTADRLGPTRAVQAGWLSPDQMRRAMSLTFALTLLPGLYLTSIGGLPIVLVGLASIVSGMAYTGGPYPLGYHGLGDLFVFVFFGLVAVCGTVYVQTGAISPLAVACSIPVGTLCTAILVVNNLRDRHTDVRAGKRTLAVRFGAGFARLEYAMLLGVAYLVPTVLVGLGWISPLALLPLISLPLAYRLTHAIGREEGRQLNPRLGQTARLMLLFALLFLPGLVQG